jgi:hypothetical protein
MPNTTSFASHAVRASLARASIVACLAISALATACSVDRVTTPSTPASLTATLSRGGGGGGGQLPAAQGPFAGTWVGQESWGPGPTFAAAWTVQVTQDSGGTALLGTAVAQLEPANRTMSGVVVSATHVLMNFRTSGGKPGISSTLLADLTLSADGRTLSGPITPFEPGLATTLTLTHQ